LRILLEYLLDKTWRPKSVNDIIDNDDGFFPHLDSIWLQALDYDLEYVVIEQDLRYRLALTGYIADSKKNFPAYG
jgi:hypothetical protein